MHSNTRQALSTRTLDRLNHGRLERSSAKRAKLLVFTIMHSNTRQALSTRTLDRLNHGRLERSSAKLRQAKSRQARALKRQASCLLRGRLTSEQSCTRTLDRQRTIMHANTRQAVNASTRSVYAKWYWVNHGRLTSERKAYYLTLPIVTHQSLDPAARALKRQDVHVINMNDMNDLERERCRGAKWYWVKSRQAHQRTAGSPANAKLITRPCCSSAQAPRRACNQHE